MQLLVIIADSDLQHVLEFDCIQEGSIIRGARAHRTSEASWLKSNSKSCQCQWSDVATVSSNVQVKISVNKE